MKQHDSPTRIFIDEQVDIYEGEQAAALINERFDNEAALVDAARGVTRVDHERWQEAQRYEKRTWLTKSRNTATDRNEFHREHFANYSPLNGVVFQRGIELGCGPFTNMRLLLEHCDVREVHLLDPLLNDYLTHPFCQYRNGRFGGLLKDVHPLRALRHPVTFARSRLDSFCVGGLRGRPVTLHASMIETYVPQTRFDLVVMVNVIEHCQDIDVVFRKVVDLLTPDGVFVFADKLYEAAEVKRLASVLYDAGHPLRVDRSVVTDFLGNHFQPLLRAEYAEEQTFRGLTLRNDDLYFIGRRRTET